MFMGAATKAWYSAQTERVTDWAIDLRRIRIKQKCYLSPMKQVQHV
jgi:hypothetical protein